MNSEKIALKALGRCFHTTKTHLRLSLFNALLAHYQASIDDFDSLVAIELLILQRSKSD